MKYRKLLSNTPNPDYEEAMAHLEADVWVKFTAALISVRELKINDATSYVDMLMIAFRERFLRTERRSEPIAEEVDEIEAADIIR